MLIYPSIEYDDDKISLKALKNMVALSTTSDKMLIKFF